MEIHMHVYITEYIKISFLSLRHHRLKLIQMQPFLIKEHCGHEKITLTYLHMQR